ncbi:class I SAM-dependent methyltransferase [Pontibacter sp. JH31]|uniref:Class I SAM-dependent methyltransferase n=1 Tax=Pontibacter aquaedesilientis TaxID=2766980 RepID=A0ABR7XHE6_9BACT|nr:class I SAM-dependent methyltransferase [Pontibacter aquaedesilientis]MBD1397700.1 class I SAM-dependent methyltransferase [Pontibacter aquaedesilientis]
MRTIRHSLSTLLMALCATFALAQTTTAPRLDVPYVPTPQPVVDAMLKLANVTEKDVLYDLGCGDGRIVITAAKQYGANATGFDINPERIAEANANAKEAKVTDKVRFVEGNLFEVDYRPASVVTLYLLPTINMKLRPMLLEQLKPGTRIVSHAFDMGDWEPDETMVIDGSTIYLWTVPEKKEKANDR